MGITNNLSTMDVPPMKPMRRLVLGLMLGLTATAASAEWTISGGNDQYMHYVDRATIRRNGNLVKMWNFFDYKKVQPSPSTGLSYLSTKQQSEYDCKEERTRILAFTTFDGKMGNGNVVFSDSDPDKWEPIGPGSVGETLWKIACGKK